MRFKPLLFLLCALSFALLAAVARADQPPLTKLLFENCPAALSRYAEMGAEERAAAAQDMATVLRSSFNPPPQLILGEPPLAGMSGSGPADAAAAARPWQSLDAEGENRAKKCAAQLIAAAPRDFYHLLPELITSPAAPYLSDRTRFSIGIALQEVVSANHSRARESVELLRSYLGDRLLGPYAENTLITVPIELLTTALCDPHSQGKLPQFLHWLPMPKAQLARCIALLGGSSSAEHRQAALVMAARRDADLQMRLRLGNEMLKRDQPDSIAGAAMLLSAALRAERRLDCQAVAPLCPEFGRLLMDYAVKHGRERSAPLLQALDGLSDAKFLELRALLTGADLLRLADLYPPSAYQRGRLEALSFLTSGPPRGPVPSTAVGSILMLMSSEHALSQPDLKLFFSILADHPNHQDAADALANLAGHCRNFVGDLSGLYIRKELGSSPEFAAAALANCGVFLPGIRSLLSKLISEEPCSRLMLLHGPALQDEAVGQAAENGLPSCNVSRELAGHLARSSAPVFRRLTESWYLDPQIPFDARLAIAQARTAQGEKSLPVEPLIAGAPQPQPRALRDYLMRVAPLAVPLEREELLRAIKNPQRASDLCSTLHYLVRRDPWPALIESFDSLDLDRHTRFVRCAGIISLPETNSAIFPRVLKLYREEAASYALLASVARSDRRYARIHARHILHGVMFKKESMHSLAALSAATPDLYRALLHVLRSPNGRVLFEIPRRGVLNRALRRVAIAPKSKVAGVLAEAVLIHDR